jgi:hypothetical protein
LGLGDAIHDFFSSGKGLVRLAADRALATGVWSALPTPSADFRGGWFRTEGGAGVEDAHYLALKNAADAPVFDEIATLAATQTFTNKTLTAPTIADFTNSQHDHGDADDGGNIPATSVTGLSAVWLETLSPSAAASSSSSAILTSTYENYLIVFNLSSQSGSVGIDLRLRAAGSDTAGTAYYWARQTRTSAAATGVEGGVGVGQFRIMGGAEGKSNAAKTLWLYRPQVADETAIVGDGVWEQSGPVIVGESNVGVHRATTQFDAFTILPGSGTITGTIRIYGLRNS